MEEPVGKPSNRDRLVKDAVFVAVVFVAVALRQRPWWVIAPALFVGLLVYMLVDGRRPLTIWWVLLAAGASIALSAVLGLI